jgi:thiol-disulfide isomerase/thioredoxin
VPRLKRRSVLLAATACAGVLAVVLLVTAFTGSSGGPVYLDGNTNAVLYPAGHRPLAPEFSGTTLTGSTLHFSSYRGKVVVLNFWGSWCPPCRAEAPALGTLSRQLSGRGVRFVGVDIRDEPDAALAFMQDFNIGYPSLNDPNDDIALLFHATVPPQAIPSTVIIDRSGRIAALIVGGVTYSSLRPLITNVAAGSS